MSRSRAGPPGPKTTVLKVVLLGDGGVGKTSLMNRFINNRFDDKSYHTIGVEFMNKDIVVNNETFTLQIWDTAGQERFRSLRTPFYRGADVCLLTYAIDDIKSLQNLSVWKREFENYSAINTERSFPYVVIGNKSDVPECDKEVTSEMALAWCRENGNSPLIETSAKEACNVERAFVIAVNSYKKSGDAYYRPDAPFTVDLRTHRQKFSSRRCCA